MSSDASGELYVIVRDQAANGTSASGTSTSSAAAAPTLTSGVGKFALGSLNALVLPCIVTLLLL